MDFVEPGLALCGLREALDPAEFQKQGIDAVLQLYTSPVERLSPPSPCEVLHLQVRDREPVPHEALDRGIEFISAHRAAGLSVLVVCGAGTSRSVTFVAGYLLRRGLSLCEAFAQIAKARPAIQPHRRLIESLIDFLGADESLDEVCAAAQSRG